MRFRSIVTALTVTVALGAAAPARAASPSSDKLKLKPGANGKLCLECHTGEFEARLQKPFVHTPVKARDCVGCHSPHASSHGKMLAAEPGKTCATCHDVVPATAKSTHKPVADGGCLTCHDPHASGFKYNLVKSQNELCSGCHKPIGEGAAKARFKHRPVEQGCATCHDPHGSAKAGTLLKTGVPELCAGCHKVDKPIFLQKHLNYPVGKARCTSCHDPHGSNVRGMLYDNVHPPVAKGMCGQCHQPPGAGTFQPKQAGLLLCKGCHAQKVGAMLDQPRVHAAVTSDDACLNCHNPHASKQKGLVKGNNMVNACGSCHSDTIKRQEMSDTKHKPIADGQCTKCHDPHGSTAALMLVKADAVELCGTCHDWQKHATHPIGAKYKDPRNQNLTMNCLSCHRAHGTEYKHMNPYATTTDLCTKCHAQFKR